MEPQARRALRTRKMPARYSKCSTIKYQRWYGIPGFWRFSDSLCRQVPTPPRTPCTGCAGGRARISTTLRTPCTGYVCGRARTSTTRRTPCSSPSALHACTTLFRGHARVIGAGMVDWLRYTQMNAIVTRSHHSNRLGFNGTSSGHRPSHCRQRQPCRPARRRATTASRRARRRARGRASRRPSSRKPRYARGCSPSTQRRTTRRPSSSCSPPCAPPRPTTRVTSS